MQTAVALAKPVTRPAAGRTRAARSLAAAAKTCVRRLDRLPVVQAAMLTDTLCNVAYTAMLALSMDVADATLQGLLDAAGAGLSAATPAETVLEAFLLVQCALLRGRRRPVELTVSAIALLRRFDNEDNQLRVPLDVAVGAAHAAASRLDAALPDVVHEAVRVLSHIHRLMP